ncbi:unnamed protein product [Caenorhabditis bovis]|uniref:Calponin-homology (CH) domain-containing protein n=1 Tax=Caenorhabditis bovis TaxID=2654633 RepID=A0A8S1EIQ9_9PELO|nr:unnamed protein product [Caenorhabditis bovis]
MLTFSWTGKRKKKSDASDGGLSLTKSKSTSDHDSSEPSVSRSTTSTGSIHFGQSIPFTSSVGTSFKEAEYSGRLLLHGLRLQEFPIEAFENVDLLDIVLLDISDNRLSTLPADFSQFDCLISCIANNNRFRSIPTCICSIEQLTYIDFSCNEISHLPDGLFDLPLVTMLLAGNNISYLPEAIRRLGPTLTYLDLSGNDISVLQPHLRFLKSLRVLKLGKNAIEEFPSELCTSLELRSLDLSQNNLSYLPLDFIKMKDLRSLQLSSNPLRSPPIHVAERGIVHIFKWLEGRTSGSGSSVGSQDFLNDKRRFVISSEKHNDHNQSRTSRGINIDSFKAYAYDSKPENGNVPRTKEITEIKSSVHPRPSNVQITQNKITSLPSTREVVNGKENMRLTDEQNNNSTKTMVSSTKKPVSKVAPMMKNTSRPTSTTQNGNMQSKIGAIRKPASTNALTKKPSVPTSSVKREIPVKNDVSKTAPVRKSMETNLKTTALKINAGSTTTLNRATGIRPVASDVENARKVMREKLGPSFATTKGDMAFSMQISDGVELCKFVNKLQPSAITLATPNDSSIASMRSKLNAERFIQYCKKLGVPENTMCTSLDILSKRNPQRVARTLLSMVKLQALQVSPTNSIQC